MTDIKNEWEIIVIGGGPAGLAAAVYGGRAGHSVLVLEQMRFGGEITNTDWVENYPGFPEGVGGVTYGELLEQQARKFGAVLQFDMLEKVDFKGQKKKVWTAEGEFVASQIIIATGTEPRKLGVKGEKELQGRGISYCATCDAAFFRDKEVAVVGGGDAAVEEALFMTRFASKVYLIHRRDSLRAAQSLQDKLFSHEGVEVFWDTELQEIKGEKKLESLLLKHKKEGLFEMPVSGVFMSVGREPQTQLFAHQIKLDPNGFIITDEEMRTSLDGVLAAGDVRYKLLRQLVTAAADGAIAAHVASRELQNF